MAVCIHMLCRVQPSLIFGSVPDDEPAGHTPQREYTNWDETTDPAWTAMMLQDLVRDNVPMLM